MRLSIVFSLLILLSSLPLSTGFGGTATARPDIVGWYYWELPNAHLQFLIKFSRDEHGHLRATTANISHGEIDRPVSAVFYNAPNFLLEFDPVGGVKGRLTDDGTRLEAVYQAGDFTLPLAFDRVDPSQFPADPPMTYAPGENGSAKLGGFWNGTLDWNGVKLRHALRVGHAADGSVRGRLDMIEQGERNIPISAIRLTNSMVRIECKSWSIIYAGRLSEDGKRIESKFESGTKSAAITFERASDPWLLDQPAAEGPVHDLEGEWQGVMDRQSTISRIVLRIGRAPDGTYRVIQRSADDPNGVPSAAVVVKFKHPELKCEWIGSDFSKSVLYARFNPVHRRLTGIWEIAGSLSPISLERRAAGVPSPQGAKKQN